MLSRVDVRFIEAPFDRLKVHAVTGRCALHRSAPFDRALVTSRLCRVLPLPARPVVEPPSASETRHGSEL